MDTLVYSGLVLFLAYFVRGMAGFGSGLIAVPLLSFVSPVTAVVPLVVSLDYLGSASQGIKNLHQIAWKEQLALVPFMLVGVGLGLYLLQAVPTAALARALGAFVIVYAVYQVLPLPALRGSRLFAIGCGLLGGLVGTLFGSGGPFYVIYLNLRNLEKTTFRATFASNFLIDGGIRLVAYVVLGLFRWETLVSMAGALPIVAAGLFLGGRMQARFSQRVFVWLISALLIASGAGLLFKG
ncbi:MAG TPA: sulfite exporter TauE/SafE family protein [Candidatus Dormibacteraeota bacterium]|nr:sulfite exporter TauE/SafE family protein [Candidatus Dormibacteraeota bacterium]